MPASPLRASLAPPLAARDADLAAALANRLLPYSSLLIVASPSPAEADLTLRAPSEPHVVAREMLRLFGPPYLPVRYHGPGGLSVTLVPLVPLPPKGSYVPSASPRVKIVEAEALDLRKYPNVHLAIRMSPPTNLADWCSAVLRALDQEQLPSDASAHHRLFLLVSRSVDVSCRLESRLALVVSPVIDNEKLDDGIALVVGGRTPLALVHNAVMGLLENVPQGSWPASLHRALAQGNYDEALWQHATALFDEAQQAKPTSPCCRIELRETSLVDARHLLPVVFIVALFSWIWQMLKSWRSREARTKRE